mgnify:CR=1 FL=1
MTSSLLICLLEQIVPKKPTMALLSGILVSGAGGASAGALSWPMKLMKKFDFEQTWFPGMLFGLILLPWLVTLCFCPNAIEAYGSVDIGIIIKSNLFSGGRLL